mmetsp:Transcript_21686/g.69227  ORF Transcript_21686/g.69227 Transcript_21686/m.69227 type:complete len:282 (+) Transcript_21686:3-848(+)
MARVDGAVEEVVQREVKRLRVQVAADHWDRRVVVPLARLEQVGEQLGLDRADLPRSGVVKAVRVGQRDALARHVAGCRSEAEGRELEDRSHLVQGGVELRHGRPQIGQPLRLAVRAELPEASLLEVAHLKLVRAPEHGAPFCDGLARLGREAALHPRCPQRDLPRVEGLGVHLLEADEVSVVVENLSQQQREPIVDFAVLHGAVLVHVVPGVRVCVREHVVGHEPERARVHCGRLGKVGLPFRERPAVRRCDHSGADLCSMRLGKGGVELARDLQLRADEV